MMDPYRLVCRNVVLPLVAWRERSSWMSHLRYLERSQYFSPEKIEAIQLGKLRTMLEHAYANTVFYRERFDGLGMKPGDVTTLADLSGLPLVRKADLQHRAQDFTALNVRPHVRYLTSGSTGQPIRGVWSKESAEFKRACGMRSNLMAGYRIGERISCLYGNPERELRGWPRTRAKFRRKFIQRTEILDMLSLSEDSMRAFIHHMRRHPPALLWGHAHGLHLLATFCERNGIADVRPRGMFSAGMVLHAWERVSIERVFGCKLQDRYGCEELGLIAAECKAQEGLHVNADDLYVEVVGANGKPVARGERGVIAVTDLSNLAQPLIRYRLEDVGTLLARPCSCGRGQPLLGSLEGRVADFLITPEGKLVSGISLTDHFAGHIPGISQMQIVQEERDFLTIVVVRGEDFSVASQQRVRELVKEFFGASMRHRFSFVTEIPHGRTGKFRFTICKVQHDML